MGLAAHLRRGRSAERAAEKLVKANGFSVVGRNVHFTPGEIDLIVRKNDLVVFIEVRARSNPDFGLAEQTVDSGKQRKLVAAANLWLQREDPRGLLNCRFDVIGYSGDASNPRVNWIENAFPGT